EAERGVAMLQALLLRDDGTRRLGEIGLVPHSSPISASNLTFYNALFDENAATHFAFGQSYSTCLDIDAGSAATLEQYGANQSSIHIDCMFGNAAMNVDGISRGGQIEPVMRPGEFVI